MKKSALCVLALLCSGLASAAEPTKLDPPPCLVSFAGICLVRGEPIDAEPKCPPQAGPIVPVGCPSRRPL